MNGFRFLHIWQRVPNPHYEETIYQLPLSPQPSSLFCLFSWTNGCVTSSALLIFLILSYFTYLSFYGKNLNSPRFADNLGYSNVFPFIKRGGGPTMCELLNILNIFSVHNDRCPEWQMSYVYSLFDPLQEIFLTHRVPMVMPSSS